MKLYRLITGPDDAAFCHRICDALAKGWELQGSPAYGFDAAAGVMKCAQAVVKTVEGKTYASDMKLGEQ
ncbi:DUF1737 domain-containing protein [Aureimonas pseudogalii]|uniref:DUF1737 domain-containing protein n=1 Tax=Aureimonas pseudogalii TaxID=1744844 RepID=A0A7W6EC39_9HYPH|nr:DUF1737 domain-containing protein [Aureimonas pseudogalii]MBB3996522.1 hypothetical protein [Aureimonas pseudogalii]